jgi:Tfp pilus assembly PilM family ATPase
MAANLGLIDLSPRRIRVLRAEPAEVRGEYRLIRREELLPSGFDSLPEVLDRLLADEVLSAGRWQLSLSGGLVSFHRLHSPLKDLRKVRLTLEFELENALPFRSEEVVVSPLLRRREDGTDILAFLTRRDRLEGLLEVFQERRIETVQVVPSSFGAVSTALTASGRHLLLDLGRDQIDIVAIEDGEIAGYSSLSGGGEQVTQMLRRSHLLDVGEAEHAKFFEGQTEEGRAALSPAVEQFSDHVQRALRGGLRSMAWSEAHVHLSGGAALLTGLVEGLAERSGLRVDIAGTIDSLTPDAASACSLAAEVGHLRAQLQGGGFQPINLRAGDLAHTTDVMKALQGFRPLAGWAAAICFLLLMQFFAGISVKDARAGRFESARRNACATIAGIEGANALQCLAAMRETITGTGVGDIPRFDAVDLLSRISQAVPANLEVKLDDIRIDERSLRLVGTTTGFQQARSLVDALSSVRCIAGLRSDKTVKKGDRVMFSLSGRVDCSVEPKPVSVQNPLAPAGSQALGTTAKPAVAPASNTGPTDHLVESSEGEKKPYQSPAQAEKKRLRSDQSDRDKAIEEPDEDEVMEDEEKEGFEEPMIDPARGLIMPNVIPDPYPGIAPFPGNTLKLPGGIGNVMRLPEDGLTGGTVPPEDGSEDEE